jgi:short-subunit dehydrogenase
MDIKDKVVIITGASSGIGKALAFDLADKGAKLALLARRKEELDKIAAKLSKKTEVFAVQADVTSEKKVMEAVKKAAGRFGRIDILVNNAGVGLFSSLEKMSMSDFDSVVKTNLYGPLYMLKAALPYLKKSKGLIVNISSGLSRRALPFLSAYGGTKSMLNAMSDGMRIELRKYGIKVLTYGPPMTDTPFIKRQGLTPEYRNRKIASAEDVAGRIVQGVIKGKREVIESGFLGVMNLFAPKVLDNLFYKVMVLKMKDV